MSRQSLFSVLVLCLLLTACSSATPAPAPTPGLSAGDAAVQLIQQDMYLRLTEQAVNNQRIETGARMTATQQVADATATQVRYEDNSRATQRAESATQAAWQVTVQAGKTQDAATQQARSGEATSTAQAQATATQQAVTGLTATVEAKNTEQAAKKTEEAPMVWARQTAVYAEAKKTEIELQKTQATMWVMAWGPIVLIVIGVLAMLYYMRSKSQVGTVPTDSTGRMQMVIINENGVRRFVNPNLMSNPVLEFHGNAQTHQPMLTDQSFQREIVHGAQVVEAVKSLPPGYQRQALGLASGMSLPQSPAVNIQVVQPGQVQGWIEDVQGQIAQRSEEDG